MISSTPRHSAILVLFVMGSYACSDSAATPSPSVALDASVDTDEADAIGDAWDLAGPEDVPPDHADADVEDEPSTEDAPPPLVCDDGWREVVSEPSEIAVDEPFVFAFEECVPANRFVVASGGSQLRLDIGDVPEDTRVTVAHLGVELASTTLADAGSLTFDADVTGEYRVMFWTSDGAPGTVSGFLTCLAGCDGEATRYPVVLMHGMAGTDSYLNILEYFFRVPDHLRDHGYVVFTPRVEFIAHSEVRAESLAPQLAEILEETGARKLHLIGHSQGGIDMRVLVSGLGWDDRVASMTTVSTPHGGLKIDIPQWLAGMNFREEYMQGEFNELYPDVESIPRFSWPAATCSRFDFKCRDRYDNERMNPLLAVSYQLLRAAHRGDDFDGDNDGVVPTASGRWGEVLGVLPADHFDEVGQIAGVREGPFDQLDFYLSEARRLRQVEIDRGL